MLEPGVIALIPFPFSDLSAGKRRPVLLLSRPDEVGDVICLAITSKGYHAHSVPVDAEALAWGALPVKSWIRTDKVYTLASSLVVRRVADVRAEVLARSLDGLCAVLQPSGR